MKAVISSIGAVVLGATVAWGQPGWKVADPVMILEAGKRHIDWLQWAIEQCSSAEDFQDKEDKERVCEKIRQSEMFEVALQKMYCKEFQVYGEYGCPAQEEERK